MRCRPLIMAAATAGIAGAGFLWSGLARADLAEQCLYAQSLDSITICEQAVEQNPGDLVLRRALAGAFVETGDFASAIEVYEAIAAEHPDDVQALKDLSGSLGFIRRYAEAAEILERLAELDPRNVETHRAMAIVYRHLQRPDRVLTATRAAAELGDEVAMFDMFVFFRDGLGTRVDAVEAISWAERAAEAGHMRAARTLVKIFLEGELGQDVDENRAIRWARRLRELRQVN